MKLNHFSSLKAVRRAFELMMSWAMCFVATTPLLQPLRNYVCHLNCTSMHFLRLLTAWRDLIATKTSWEQQPQNNEIKMPRWLLRWLHSSRNALSAIVNYFFSTPASNFSYFASLNSILLSECYQHMKAYLCVYRRNRSMNVSLATNCPRELNELWIRGEQIVHFARAPKNKIVTWRVLVYILFWKLAIEISWWLVRCWWSID